MIIRKKILWVFLIIVFYLAFSIRIIGPISGTIKDAKTKEPIENMKIIYTIYSKYIGGIEAMITSEKKDYYSDKNGSFIIPRKIKFYPLLLSEFLSDRLSINSMDILQSSHDEYYHSSLYNNSYYPYFLNYSTDTRLYNKELFFEDNKYTSKRNLEIQLIPKFKSIQECDLIKEARYYDDRRALTLHQDSIKK